RALCIIGAERFEEGVPAAGRPADAELIRDFAGESAIFQIVDRRGRRLQLLSVETRGVLEHGVKVRAAAFTARRVAAFAGYVDAELSREFLDRVNELHVFVFD